MARKGKHIWKFGQKCMKFENIFKKGKWLRVIIAHNKLLEKALFAQLGSRQKNLLSYKATDLSVIVNTCCYVKQKTKVVMSMLL